MKELILAFIGYLVLATQGSIVLLLLMIGLRMTVWRQNSHPFIQRWEAWLKRYAVALALLVSVVSMLGSLFMSNIMDWFPCHLCWWQRIFMFSIPLILGVLLLMRERRATLAVLPGAMVGAAIGAYHWWGQVSTSGTACAVSFDATGAISSCSESYVMFFGYMSIPMMALTGFVAIIILLLLGRK